MMESTNIFDKKFQKLIDETVKVIQLEKNDTDFKIERPHFHAVKEETEKLSCSYCKVKFDDLIQQREHYKLDWHRYNLKQSLVSKQPISEEEFFEKNDRDGVSSISGSDSEKEDTIDTLATAQGKIFLQNDSKTVFSLYRCLILEKKEEITEKNIHYRLKETCINNTQWCILMLGGGHFAGAIFQNNAPILHKTFHCYTVRAGQGGSQSSRDGRSNSQPKSAGASLRRYNEQALIQHVKGIVEVWSEEIKKCSLISYRASGPYNRAVLFGGNAPLLDRADPRLRTIPFSTRRATYTEVQRVYNVLTSIQIYESLDEAQLHFGKQKTPETDPKKARAKSACINRAKSRERVDRPLPVEELSDSSDCEDLNDSTYEIVEETVDFKELLEGLEDTRVFAKKSKKKKPKKSKAKKLREKTELYKKKILDVLFQGNLVILKEKLEEYLHKDQNEDNEEKPSPEQLKNDFFNEILDDSGNSLLHVAALNEHEEIMEYLLQNGADPCRKNKNQHTAYTCTQSKEIRDVLRKFARDNPEKYNYNKAQIPINTLTEDEIADKKRNQRKLKREKEKEKKKENEVKKKEQHEKDRFLQLSDREKRALAAERRILNQSGVVISRCFLCASDMSGKVPFEYLGNRFCSIDCLKAHRLQSPLVLS
ncbi:unnamed protein product [Brassicogethes aeneus]|uniref:VLRF1 domain-containing protein n=1 Tax=Brassicogethes aeneus TaxID=1431903 RepID=A0A9P0BJG8_BRAAE|nr:unnamed protein product [Brassicogethes aeneus]